MTLPLFAAYPELAATLPWLELGTLPTPVLTLPDKAAQLGLASLTLKRDDRSASHYGGNKIRKLEFLLADALHRGCTSVLTYGGLGSNHALATAIYCREHKLRCAALLTHEPVTPAVRATLAYHAQLDTALELVPDYSGIRAQADRRLVELGGSRCYEIPFGGSSWVGTLGFVNAALELAAQITADELPAPDVIYVACGTAGTVAGLALGCRLAGLATRIEGIQVTPDSMQPAKLATELCTRTAAELHQRCGKIPDDLSDANARVRNDQLGAGYAAPTAAGRAAQAEFTALTDLPCSLTYTAKAMAALLADAEARLLEQRHVLFWNTYNSVPYPPPPHDWEQALPADLRALLGAAPDAS